MKIEHQNVFLTELLPSKRNHGQSALFGGKLLSVTQNEGRALLSFLTSVSQKVL